MATTTYKDVELGDVVTFVPDELRIEVQGRVMGFFEHEGNLYTEIFLLRRGAVDILTGKNRIFQYRDSETLVEIPASKILRRIPSQTLPLIKGKAAILEEFRPRERTKGAIYISDACMEDGRVRSAQPVDIQLMWFHFNPGAVESFDDLVFDPLDIATGLLCTFKAKFFDPFVSALSPSRRRTQILWNQKSWRLILKAARGDIPAQECYQQIGEMGREKQEILYCPETVLPVLVLVMNEWLTDYEHLTLYDAIDEWKKHERMFESILDKHDEELTHLAKKEAAQDRRLHAQLAKEDEELSRCSYITDGSGTSEEGPETEEESLESSDCESSVTSADTSDFVESDRESEYE